MIEDIYDEIEEKEDDIKTVELSDYVNRFESKTRIMKSFMDMICVEYAKKLSSLLCKNVKGELVEKRCGYINYSKLQLLMKEQELESYKKEYEIDGEKILVVCPPEFFQKFLMGRTDFIMDNFSKRICYDYVFEPLRHTLCQYSKSEIKDKEDEIRTCIDCKPYIYDNFYWFTYSFEKEGDKNCGFIKILMTEKAIFKFLGFDPIVVFDKGPSYFHNFNFYSFFGTFNLSEYEVASLEKGNKLIFSCQNNSVYASAVFYFGEDGLKDAFVKCEPLLINNREMGVRIKKIYETSFDKVDDNNTKVIYSYGMLDVDEWIDEIDIDSVVKMSSDKTEYSLLVYKDHVIALGTVCVNGNEACFETVYKLDRPLLFIKKDM